MSQFMLPPVSLQSRIARPLRGDANLAHAPRMRAGAFAGGMAGARPYKVANDGHPRILVAWALLAVAAKTFTGTCGAVIGSAAARPQAGSEKKGVSGLYGNDYAVVADPDADDLNARLPAPYDLDALGDVLPVLLLAYGVARAPGVAGHYEQPGAARPYRQGGLFP